MEMQIFTHVSHETCLWGLKTDYSNQTTDVRHLSAVMS